VNIDVVGTNDAPLMQTQTTARTFTEDSGVNGSGNITATGIAQFSDVDLTDTHTTSAALVSAILSNGHTVPASVAALAATAIPTPVLLDDSNGDGQGGAQWNFALANSALQFLAQGESLTLKYNVTVTDPFGASASQVVNVTINGVNDPPVINEAQGSAAT